MSKVKVKKKRVRIPDEEVKAIYRDLEARGWMPTKELAERMGSTNSNNDAVLRRMENLGLFFAESHGMVDGLRKPIVKPLNQQFKKWGRG